jgi:hypothetical protein
MLFIAANAMVISLLGWLVFYPFFLWRDPDLSNFEGPSGGPSFQYLQTLFVCSLIGSFVNGYFLRLKTFDSWMKKYTVGRWISFIIYFVVFLCLLAGYLLLYLMFHGNSEGF